MASVRKDKGIAAFSHEVGCSEGTARRLANEGILAPIRDPWGRRLFGEDDVLAARKYLKDRRHSGPK